MSSVSFSDSPLTSSLTYDNDDKLGCNASKAGTTSSAVRERNRFTDVQSSQREELTEIAKGGPPSSFYAGPQESVGQRPEEAFSSSIHPFSSAGPRIATADDSAPNRSPRFPATQQQLTTSPEIIDRRSLSVQHDNSRSRPPTTSSEEQHDATRKLQQRLNTSTNYRARCPTNEDFDQLLVTKIIKPTKEPVEHCFILLHDGAYDETQLKPLAKGLRIGFAESAFILLRGLWAIPKTPSGYLWRNLGSEHDESHTHTNKMLLENVIKNVLTIKCCFQPQNIVILDRGQGGTAACWNEVEFGGVISIGGPGPANTQPESASKARTPVLLLSGTGTSMDADAVKAIEDRFTSVDDQSSSCISRLASLDIMRPLQEFLAHRLRREEWTKQAVICFDGGGIRGYGSLLILRELMNKIGDRERLLGETESSFSPCDYRPTTGRSSHSYDEDPQSPGLERDAIIATATHNLPKSSLFLPCHYFTYAAGTSTGGLISIMLSRLRMSVDECLQEYETLGGKIFGHPRPLSNKGLLWHKFDHKKLEKAIKEVTAKYDGQPNEFESHYALNRMDEDMFQCIVVAYADNASGDEPYLFRTFPTDQDAQSLPIWEVARATSAAPGYFPPIKIQKGNGPEYVAFKDGGFGSNNPSEVAYKAIIKKHGGHVRNMGPFISIGTGEKPLNKFVPGGRFKKARDFSNNIAASVRSVSRGFNAHSRMLDISTFNKEKQFPYYRFEGGERLGNLGLGEWKTHKSSWFPGRSKNPGSKTLEEVQEIVNAYLTEPNVRRDLQRCAEILVDRRRLRARNASAWDRYACFSYYECEFEGCQKKRINTIHEFRDHVRSLHPLSEAGAALDMRLHQYRKVHWIYNQNITASTARGRGEGRA